MNHTDLKKTSSRLKLFKKLNPNDKVAVTELFRILKKLAQSIRNSNKD